MRPLVRVCLLYRNVHWSVLFLFLVNNAADVSVVSGLDFASQSDTSATSSSNNDLQQRKRVSYDVDLDDTDKLIIVAGVAAFLLIVLVVLVCALKPGCPLHAVCPVDYGDGCKKAKGPPGPAYGSMDDPSFFIGNGATKGKTHSVKSNDKQHSPKVGVHPSDRGLPGARRPHLKSHRDSSEPSDWSDVSVPEMIELKQEPNSKHHRKVSKTSDYSSSAGSIPSPVQPESRLAYGLKHDKNNHRLYIRVIQLGNFRVTDPDGALSPYVKVRVYRVPRHFFSFKRYPKDLPLNQVEAEMQTRIQRRTDNPVFNEYFELVIQDPDLTQLIIKFLVCDFDRFSRHIIVGEVTVDLSKVNLSSGEEVLATDLIECHQEDNLGDIHIALMYLPTAEKLSVTILNARGLSSLDSSKKHTEVLVKIIMMFEGRPLKKTKTSSRLNDSNPIFNETFVFDVPAYQLDRVYFHVAVIGIDKDREDGRHLLGRLYIGVNFDADARSQWLEMVHNARKQVASWHMLQS